MTKQQPLTGQQKAKFVNVNEIPKGASVVVVNGPYTLFICQDCGRILTARSLFEHWKKSHEDKHVAGLRNMAAWAMNQYLTLEGYTTPDTLAGTKQPATHTPLGTKSKKLKPAPNPPAPATTTEPASHGPNFTESGPAPSTQLFGPRYVAAHKNPFFKHVDAQTPIVQISLRRQDWKKELFAMKKKGEISTAQEKVAQQAIDAWFDKQESV